MTTMTTATGTWRPYAAGRPRARVTLTCAGCAATTAEPHLYRWVWMMRDGRGERVSRCPRCSPVTFGRPSDQTFGAAASRSRGGRRATAVVRAKRAREERG